MADTAARTPREAQVRLAVEGPETSVTPFYDVAVARTADGEFYEGRVGRYPFRMKVAMRETARMERAKALRRAAAWQAIMDLGMTTGDES